MSEPEPTYMTGNEDFDLPRWQTQAHIEPLSSSAQAAHAAAHGSSYLYGSAPPPPPPPSSAAPSAQRLSSQLQSPTNARQPRITQLLEQDQQLGTPPPGYLSTGQSLLSRSASLGGGAPSSQSSRARRQHHPVDDLEGAFTVDSHSPPQHVTSVAQSQPSFYPPNIAAYHRSALTGTNPAPSNPTSPMSEQYQDLYVSGSNNPPKRSQTQHDASTSSRPPRSPLRTNPANNITNQSNSLLDPYSPQHQQSQYSPSSVPYTFGSGTEQVRGHASPAYQSHSRSHSQVKGEMISPTTSPYSPQQQMQAGGYAPSYSMDTSSPQPPTSHNTVHLTASHSVIKQESVSSPGTPMNYMPSQSPNQYYPGDQPMVVEVPQKRRESGFRRLRDARELRPYVNQQPSGRRMDTHGNYLSPLRQLTTNIVDTYHICNPQFRYESTHNPRRVLTKPSKPSHNDGYDNEDYDYILYVNDWLGTEEGHKYLILDILGQGTFGQVVKCQNMKTHEIVAVKVVKNKPAYFNQSMMEVTILELLNSQCDPHDEHHILRLHDSFIHKNHLCLVFELLSSNLYELIKQNQFQGLSTQLVKVFTAQLLDALTVLKDARLIHCDLKPENILLKSLQSPQIKVIDFGSACHERQTVYTYIQSRFYRSPEVLLGIPYTAAIDMWSLGCIAVELFLGLPLFPGTSEYNQITRIVEMLGMPPAYMLEMGKQTNQFFDSYTDMYGHKKWRLKSIEQYSREHNTNEQPGKQYFKANSLPEIINTAPMPAFKSSSSSRQGHEMEKELNNRASFIDFCQGLLNLNPIERWSPQQARMHPFITGEKFTKPFQPSTKNNQVTTPPSSAPGADPKRPYGGLVPSQPKGTRAYQDAASYGQQLAHHQAYTAQAQAASQAANNVYRNPYLQASTSQSQQQPASSSYANAAESIPSQQQNPSQYPAGSVGPGHRGLVHQTSAGHLAVNTSVGQFSGQGSAGGSHASSHLGPNPPSSSYYSGSRARANTINQMDAIPPALARLQQMNQDVIAGRNALTPVLNRDDAMREWERRQAGGKPAASQPYPQLEYLHQQAELAAASGLTSWGSHSNSNRYPPPTSKLAHSYHPNMVVDDDRRDVRALAMSNVRSAARSDGPANLYSSAANVISSPPQTYSSNTTTTGNRYASTFTQQQTPTSSFDPVERRADIGGVYVPIQPDQYQSYSGSGSSAQSAHSMSARHIAPPAQTVAPSFYGAGVVPSGAPPSGLQPQRAPFGSTEASPQAAVNAKDNRRASGMDIWPR